MGRWMLRLAAAGTAALVLVPAAQAGGVPARRSFLWPASGAITTPFSGYHPGIDIGMLRSLDIRAAAAGVVQATGYATGFEGYGNIVLVDLGGGVQTLYAHLSRPLVHVGEHVVPGKLLGIAGCTGYCTGTHLHFEVRRDGTAISPMQFLPGGIPELPSQETVQRFEIALAARDLLARLPRIELTSWLAPPVAPQPAPDVVSLLLSAPRPFP